MQPSKGLHSQVVKIVVPYSLHCCTFPFPAPPIPSLNALGTQGLSLLPYPTKNHDPELQRFIIF